MSADRPRRGQPLAALLLVLGGWVGLRALTWDALALTLPAASRPAASVARARAGAVLLPARAAVPIGAFYSPWPSDAYSPEPREVAMIGLAPTRAGMPLGSGPTLAASPPAVRRERGGWFRYDLADGVGAGFVRGAGDKPDAAPTGFPGGNAAPGVPPAATSGGARRRWSGDAWALLRGDSPGPLANGAAPASYGASQAGAVLRYGFAPGSAMAPAAYLRASAALGSVRAYEGALGLQAHPLAALPLVLAAEARVTHDTYGTRVRPAGFAFTLLPPFALPLRARGEAYLQGGWVGGAGATPFVDGQLRVDRALGTYRRAAVRLGAGAWGGAQRGAARLDVGPGATLGLPLGHAVSARVAVDYRLRVAGNAEPGSGPALTLSAGF